MAPRIVLIGPLIPRRGGIAEYTAALATHLQKYASLTVLSFKRLYPKSLYPGELSSESLDLSSGFNSEAILDSLDPISWVRTVLRIHELEPSKVILHWWHLFFAPLTLTLIILIRGFSAARIVVICHNIVPHDSSSGIRFLSKMTFRIIVRLVDQVVFHSPEQYHDTSPTSRSKFSLLPHPRYSPPVSVESKDCCKSIVPDQFQGSAVITFFGFIRPYKGLHTLIEAFALLTKELDVRLIIAGECWGSWQPYSDLISRLDLKSKIHLELRFLSNCELGELLRNSTAVALPYWSATQSGAVALALGYAVPVVASAVGGISDQIIQDETGILVKPNDPIALYEGLQRVLNPEINNKMRENILRTSTEEWDSLCQTLIS